MGFAIVSPGVFFTFKSYTIWLVSLCDNRSSTSPLLRVATMLCLNGHTKHLSGFSRIINRSSRPGLFDTLENSKWLFSFMLFRAAKSHNTRNENRHNASHGRALGHCLPWSGVCVSGTSRRKRQTCTCLMNRETSM